MVGPNPLRRLPRRAAGGRLLSGPFLVLGAAGQLGQEFMTLAATRGANAIGTDVGDLDIRDPSAVAAAIERHKPRLIVNCAAYTAVDKAESEPDLAAALNGTAPGTIALAAAAHDIAMLHISTDYVFDGRKQGAYTEDDPVGPLGVYGRTKADGDVAVRQAARRHVILRTSWVYGRYGGNFLKTMLRLAGERDRLRIVADQRGCPTATADIAEAILAVDKKLASDPSITGTFHFAGTGVTTWHGFAEAIVAAQANVTGKRPSVDAIGTADYPTPARRPANSELDSSRFVATFGYRARSWRERTDEVVAQLLGG